MDTRSSVLCVQPSVAPEDFLEWWENAEDVTSLRNLPRSAATAELRHLHADVGGFPIDGLIMAASNPYFLESLGEPVLVLDHVRSRPEAWVFSVGNGPACLVLTSDGRRAEHWKGGDFGFIDREGETLTVDHPVIKAFGETMVKVWGRPILKEGQLTLPDLEWHAWFEQRKRELNAPKWPVADSFEGFPLPSGDDEGEDD